MIDQIIIGDKSSFDDFGASVAQRKIKMPKKKSIKETVPFSNRTYDFSAINGEVYWEERELEYVFEIMADTPEHLEYFKSEFAAWVAGVQGQWLHDPHIYGYHFIATYDDLDPEDDEGLDKTTITVKFTAYPYMIANAPKVYDVVLPASEQKTTQVFNESKHPISMTIANTTHITMKVGSATTASLPASTSGTYGALKLPPGLVTIELTNSEAVDGTVRISFYEEVF